MQNLHLGTIGWSYSFWRGTFYPNKTGSKDFLAYYASKFSTVEVDNTFYRIPSQQAIANWKEQTPDGFSFSLKFPGVITHVKMLKDCQSETDLFLERAKILKEKLGPLLLQFPHSFGIERLSSLADFLHPKTQRYVIEVRDEGFLNDAFYSLLRDSNVALAWVDNPFMPSISEVTSDFLYVRWEGDREKVKGTLGKIEVDVQENLRLWADKIKPYLSKEMNVFGYFGKYYSGYPPLLDVMSVGCVSGGFPDPTSGVEKGEVLFDSRGRGSLQQRKMVLHNNRCFRFIVQFRPKIFMVI